MQRVTIKANQPSWCLKAARFGLACGKANKPQDQDLSQLKPS
jgi:hypothetical protein